MPPRLLDPHADWTHVLSTALPKAEDRRLTQAFRANLRSFIEPLCKIRTKDARIVPLRFWPEQELVYRVVQEMREAGRPVRIVLLKARQRGMCLDPSTRVLTADLRWVAMGDLHVGDTLVTVEEGRPTGHGTGRRMLRGDVEGVCNVYAPAYKLTMDCGETLIATGQHRFLSRRRGGVETCWRYVDDFELGDSIRYVTKPWGAPGVEDGWFGGLLDGEGTMALPSRNGGYVAISQGFGPVLDRATQYLASRGYNFRIDVDSRKSGDTSKLGNHPVVKLVVSRMNEIFRLVGQTRPVRFMDRFWWVGKGLPGKKTGCAWSCVVAIEALGARRMVDLQTSTGTYIAEGFVSHNSTLGTALMYARARLWPNSKCMMLANDQDTVETIFQMIKLYHQMMPNELRPMTSRNAKDVLRFENPRAEQRVENPGLMSEIVTGTAAKATIGRGYTLQGFMGTEVAMWPADILHGALNALARVPDSIGILESTANGAGGLYHDIWEDALQPDSEWVPVFLPFWMSPDYESSLTPNERQLGLDPPLSDYEQSLIERFKDIDPITWIRKIKWRRKICISECRGSELITRQEFPSSSSEAFIVQGQSVFDPASIQFYAEKIRKPMAVGRLVRVGSGLRAQVQFIEDPAGPLQIWKKPDRCEQYSIGADAALGQDTSEERAAYLRRTSDTDFSAAVVTSWRREVVALLRTRDMNPYEFGEYCALLGAYYTWAMIYPEAGNDGGGQGMLYQLKQVYPRIGRWQRHDHMDQQKLTAHLGFETSVRTKSILLGELMRELKRGAGRLTPEQAGTYAKLPKLVIPSKEIVRELSTYVMNSRGAIGAARHRHDDAVIALALSLMGLKQMPAPPSQQAIGARIVVPDRTWYDSDVGSTDSAWNPTWMGV